MTVETADEGAAAAGVVGTAAPEGTASEGTAFAAGGAASGGRSPETAHRGHPVAVRPDLSALAGYHSPQVDVEVRLNTNESPFAPPPAFLAELRDELGRIAFNRYPDRRCTDLRTALAAHHGVGADQVFCATGSNEVLQCLLLAYGGAGRAVATFEPSYTLHRHIAEVTGTPVVSAPRDAAFALDLEVVDELERTAAPVITFVCSPNNPTGRAETLHTIQHVLDVAPGLVVVDEAYGQFARASALDLVRAGGPEAQRLVVVRTFSKTFGLAAMRLGYMVADPAVVAACELVVLPYNVDAVSQAAGRLALRHAHAMDERVGQLVAERRRVQTALGALPVQTWPSDANFVLFRPLHADAVEIWRRLVDRSVLIRDCSGWPGLDGCLRVTIGSPEENDRFLAAVDESLR